MMDVVAQTAPDNHLVEWNNREVRKPTFLVARVVLSNRLDVPVIITDISGVGCRVECNATLPIADIVTLLIGNDALCASVFWALPSLAGLRVNDGFEAADPLSRHFWVGI